ncbi:MAG: CAP domain-containing protein [Saprospiraceae bacterium]|nr:CAP domain-containing protein [Saprospiraceae bacterium]
MRSKHNLFLLALSFPLLILTACTSLSSAEEEQQDTEEEETSAPPSGFASDILAEVNSFRELGYQCGNKQMPAVAPLSWSTELASAALLHAQDMSDHTHFSHKGTNGSTSAQRAEAAGYNWITIGENIAFGHPNISSVVQGWMDSKDHCKNIMNPAFKDMGAGEKGTYWSQTLGARR